MKKILLLILLSCVLIIFAGGHGIIPVLWMPVFVLSKEFSMQNALSDLHPVEASTLLSTAGLIALLFALILPYRRAVIAIAYIGIALLSLSFIPLIYAGFAIGITYIALCIFYALIVWLTIIISRKK